MSYHWKQAKYGYLYLGELETGFASVHKSGRTYDVTVYKPVKQANFDYWSDTIENSLPTLESAKSFAETTLKLNYGLNVCSL